MEHNTKASSKTCTYWQTKSRWQNNYWCNFVCTSNGLQVDWLACKVRFQIICTSQVPELATTRNVEEYLICSDQICIQAKQNQPAKDICRLQYSTRQKRGNLVEYDGFKKILGTKVHVATEQNGLPVSIIIGPANQHDSTRFADVMESTSDYLDTRKIKSVCLCWQGLWFQNH